MGSGILHGLLFLVLKLQGVLPALDFELHLPPPVELGLIDVPPTPPAAASPAEPVPPRSRPSSPRKPEGEAAAATRKPLDAPLAHADSTAFSAYAPAGAAIELRLHLARIRSTDLAPDISALLRAIPDWQAIVGDSELEPLEELERLYLASPDLRRSKLVIAGQYSGGDARPRRAVERLAQARGITPRWRKRAGIPVADWLNRDPTPRVVALIAPHQFVITRSEDLGRVLQIAVRARGQRATTAAATAEEAPERVGDSLLGLARDALLALSVEGVPRFVRGNSRGIPLRMQATVQLRPGSEGTMLVSLQGEFNDEAAAARAQQYWERQRDRFAANPLVAFTGMRPVLIDARLVHEARRVHITTTVTTQQARVILGVVRGAFAPPPADDANNRLNP